MYAACVVNYGAKNKPRQTPIVVYFSIGETPEKAAAFQLNNARGYRVNYPSNDIEVLVGLLNMRAEDPQPIVELVPIKGD